MNESLLADLNDLKQRDAQTRERLLKAGKLYGTYDEEMQRVHTENAQALDCIVALHGWPGLALVGLEGCRAAWFVAQHAIGTPALQRRFLQHLEAAVASGDAPAKQVAFLSDRIRSNEGRPQIYGTVLDWDEHGELNCELEDPEQVDGRRQSVGLPPFLAAVAEHRQEVQAEGGMAPADWAAYKAAQQTWAEQVGWR